MRVVQPWALGERSTQPVFFLRRVCSSCPIAELLSHHNDFVAEDKLSATIGGGNGGRQLRWRGSTEDSRAAEPDCRAW